MGQKNPRTIRRSAEKLSESERVTRIELASFAWDRRYQVLRHNSPGCGVFFQDVIRMLKENRITRSTELEARGI
jgi:hypothetical protein